MILELKKANRYEEVIAIINNIINDTISSYPLHMPYVDATCMTVWRVDGETVRMQAKILLELINSDSDGNTSDDFTELGAYVHSTCDILLHNYAVAISHKNAPEIDMDDIRPWEILDNLILCWGNNHDAPWTIPNGWCKIA